MGEVKKTSNCPLTGALIETITSTCSMKFTSLGVPAHASVLKTASSELILCTVLLKYNSLMILTMFFKLIKCEKKRGYIHSKLGVDSDTRDHGWDVAPSLGDLDHAASVHESETVARAHLEAALVDDVVVRTDGVWSRGNRYHVHDVAPCEFRIRFQC